jgi:hypothetical protein
LNPDRIAEPVMTKAVDLTALSGLEKLHAIFAGAAFPGGVRDRRRRGHCKTTCLDFGE